MRLAGLALVLSGCVVGSTIIRPHAVTLPMLIGAVALDLAVTSILASQVRSFSAGATIATDLAVTGVDVGVGCLLDACASLKP